MRGPEPRAYPHFLHFVGVRGRLQALAASTSTAPGQSALQGALQPLLGATALLGFGACATKRLWDGALTADDVSVNVCADEARCLEGQAALRQFAASCIWTPYHLTKRLRLS
jgi:hypothetical protein